MNQMQKKYFSFSVKYTKLAIKKKKKKTKTKEENKQNLAYLYTVSSESIKTQLKQNMMKIITETTTKK
jgi:hypothetical protein